MFLVLSRYVRMERILFALSLSDLVVQVLEDAPFPALKPTLEALIVDREPDKQRAAAELIAGVLGGM